MSRYCSQCKKALKACICQWISPIDSTTELVILQHPSEEKRPLGTARILSLSLPKTRVLVGEDFTDNETLNRLLDDDIETSVLFPGERAFVLPTQRSSELSTSAKRFILIDGTWKKAYKIWQLSTNLHSLPQVRLPEELQGDYRIRKAPSENSLSTVEAGYHLLSIIEPERDFSALLSAFKNMIDFQIQQMPPDLYRKHYGND